MTYNVLLTGAIDFVGCHVLWSKKLSPFLEGLARCELQLVYWSTEFLRSTST
jgi:hypothetical protein